MDLRPRTETAFATTRDQLVSDFDDWAEGEVIPEVADLVLAGRFALGEWQDLTSWPSDLVAAVVRDWMPHAAIGDDSYVEVLPHSMAAFLRYLTDVHDVDLDTPPANFEADLQALLPRARAATTS